jgi:transcriptional regulator with XRE-family HTH domain
MSEPNYELVRERLQSTRYQRGLNLRDAAQEIGVSAPTLSRIERGASTPDVPTLNRLIDWLDLDRNKVFNAPPTETESIPEAVDVLLRADKKLDAKTAQALSVIFKAAYEEFAGAPGRKRR